MNFFVELYGSCPIRLSGIFPQFGYPHFPSVDCPWRWLRRDFSKKGSKYLQSAFLNNSRLKVLSMGLVPPKKKNDWFLLFCFFLLCICYACLYVRHPSLGWILVWQRQKVEGSPIMGLPWAPIRPRQNHHSLRTRLLSSPWWWWRVQRRCWLCWWWCVMGQTHHSLRISSSPSMATGSIQTINIAIFHH